MPSFRTGNMWCVYHEAELFLITTNSSVTQKGVLIMGRGIAKEARDRFPGLDKALGQQIQKQCGSPSAPLRACTEPAEVTGLGVYGLLISPRWPVARLGAFQVKTNAMQAASLVLIQKSTTALCVWCQEHPQASVHLNFPGIGAGRLLREKVLPIIEQLPETVCIWEYGVAESALPAPALNWK